MINRSRGVLLTVTWYESRDIHDLLRPQSLYIKSATFNTYIFLIFYISFAIDSCLDIALHPFCDNIKTCIFYKLFTNFKKIVEIIDI